MIRPICRDILILGRKSEPATKEDAYIVDDLLDTLKAHRDGCVGMAANMIGCNKNIIVVNMGMKDEIMINPVITDRKEPYETDEGCLSLDGVRHTIRYDKITVAYLDRKWKKQKRTYEGWTAQIIQHEVDHLSGILI